MKFKTIIKTVVITAIVTLMGTPIFAKDYEGIITESHNARQILQDGEVNEFPVSQEEHVEILKEEESYYEVALKSGYIVEIDKDKVLVEKPEVKEEVKVASSKGDEIVAYAKKFQGTPYVYGGNSLTKGVDCSGFTSQIFKKFGINLERSSRSQFANNGRKISKGELQAGDLVFYGYNGSVTHIAIYIGDSKVIHASTDGRGVVIDPLDLRGMPPFVGFKRVL